MDPINNPTPTPNPTPAPTPDPVSNPVPVAPAPEVSPVPEPVSNPTPPPVVPSPVTTPPPVNPVINPTGNPVANPSFQPSRPEIPATDPIMKPEPAKAPDPIEEELKAPMKAAGPVPGSIGSAVSGPANDNAEVEAPVNGNPFDNIPKERAQNVSFNDPAMVSTDAQGGNIASGPAKKPQNKKTLIALVAVAAVIVVVLVVILVMQLLGGNSSPSGNVPEPVSGGGDTPATSMGVLNCSRYMTNEEMAAFDKTMTQGTIEMSAKFDEKNLLESINLSKYATFADSSSAPKDTDVEGQGIEQDVEESEIKKEEEPKLLEEIEAEAVDITEVIAKSLYLLDDGNILVDEDEIKAHYEDLAFTCESL